MSTRNGPILLTDPLLPYIFEWYFRIGYLAFSGYNRQREAE